MLKLREQRREPKPANLDPRLGAVAAGVYRLEGQLMVVLDVDRVLESRTAHAHTPSGDDAGYGVERSEVR